MAEWISVKETMPKDNIAVLVWEKQGFAYVDECENGKWKIGEQNLAVITHWIPIPEPPKEET